MTLAKPRRWLLVVGALILVCIAALAYVLIRSWYETSPASWPTDVFTAENWRAYPPSDRYKLYNDLTQKDLLAGKTYEQVIALLGKPDYVAPDKRYMTYVIKSGAGERYSMNFVYLLHIDLSEEGSVQKYAVRAD